MAKAQNIEYCRADFPALQEKVHGRPLAFLDTAASAQKPQIVIDKMREVMERYYANIHRGLYHFSQVATAEYESVRGKVADFINAPSEQEIVFTRNATEAINLVAASWGGANLKAGDEIILTAMEHHANIVPWQMIAEKTGTVIKVIPLLGNQTFDMEAYKKLLGPKTKLVSIVYISNALGAENPVQEIISLAKANNADTICMVDASQAVVHGHVDVQALSCDFLCFTGHKLYGPTGAGVLWGRKDLLDSMPPYQGGGDMIERVSFSGTTFKQAPQRFEAGTPAFVDVIGLGAAIDYVRTVGQDNIVAHEEALIEYAMQELPKVGGLVFYGPEGRKGIIAFRADWAQHSDIAMILDRCGVAVRAGHHCCMPLMETLGIEGTIRASVGLYTNKDDIDSLVQGLLKAKELLS
jgi:cysteine desulfurase/selenocysteine lyase